MLDYAAIGISALAAIGTLFAVGVAVWQTRRASLEAGSAQREASKLRVEAAEREERHHRELREIQLAAQERERVVRLDALAREAARLTGAERVTLVWAARRVAQLDESWMQLILSVPMEDGMRDLEIYINDELATWERHGSDPSKRENPRKSGRRANVIGNTSFQRDIQITEKQFVSLSSLSVDARFSDVRGNRWRLDDGGGLFLIDPKFVGVDTPGEPTTGAELRPDRA